MCNLPGVLMAKGFSMSEKVAIISVDLTLATITSPIELSMLPPELFLPWILFKLWMFIGVPTAFLIVMRREKK